MGGIADMEMKPGVVKPTLTRADRVKRGFERIALVGAAVAGVLVVCWVVETNFRPWRKSACTFWKCAHLGSEP